MNALFSDKEWVGEFFIPGQYEKRFSGEIKYSPESGVVLIYSITDREVPAESEVLSGVLNNGEKCTLVGKFSPQYAGTRFKHGFTTRPGRNGFLFLLIGDYVTHDELFFHLDFSLSNMQEFFFPKGYKSSVEYSETPLFILKTCYGEIEVGNIASFDPLGKNIASQIFSLDKSALEELKASFSEIESKYPHSFFMLKKDIAYRIRLKIDSGATIRSAYEYMTDIANLFSILIYRPVRPESIYIEKKIDDEHTLRLEVFPSIALERGTIGLCTEEISHLDMPITASKIDVSSVMDAWIKAPRAYSTVVSSIQHETGFRDEHSTHGEIVLYATQLESISYNEGKKKTKKYEYPIDTYGSVEVREGLRKIFQRVGESDLGKGVGTLRDEIAHVRKRKKILPLLSLRDMIRISQCLHLTIIAYILTSLGINKDIIDDYQYKFAPRV